MLDHTPPSRLIALGFFAELVLHLVMVAAFENEAITLFAAEFLVAFNLILSCAASGSSSAKYLRALEIQDPKSAAELSAQTGPAFLGFLSVKFFDRIRRRSPLQAIESQLRATRAIFGIALGSITSATGFVVYQWVFMQ